MLLHFSTGPYPPPVSSPLLQLHRPARVSSTYCLFLPITLSSCCPLPGFPFLLLMVNMPQPQNEAEVLPLPGSLPGPTFLPSAPDTPSCLCSQVDGVLLCVLPEGCLLWILEPCNYLSPFLPWLLGYSGAHFRPHGTRMLSNLTSFWLYLGSSTPFAPSPHFLIF